VPFHREAIQALAGLESFGSADNIQISQ